MTIGGSCDIMVLVKVEKKGGDETMKLVEQRIRTDRVDKIAILFEGSGNPEDEHVMVGVKLYHGEVVVQAIGKRLIDKPDIIEY